MSSRARFALVCAVSAFAANVLVNASVAHLHAQLSTGWRVALVCAAGGIFAAASSTILKKLGWLT